MSNPGGIAMVAMPPTTVFAEYMMPGPTRFRTAFKSLVSFDISSPVGVRV